MPLPGVGLPFEWRTQDGLTRLVARLTDHARAVFSTRTGGVSEAPYASLNLGILGDDDSARVAENRRRLVALAGLEPQRIAMGWQIHASRIRFWPAAPANGLATGRPFLDRVDGHATAARKLGLLVLVADCVPVALATPCSVAMLHCGWRGLAAGIVPRGVAALLAAADDSRAPVTAVVGPAVGPCCYEVGEEVADTLARRGHGPALDRGRLDLVEIVRRELTRAGVDRQRIHAAGLCTSCHPALFFSHRRDGQRTGRQAGIVWRT